MWAVPAWGGEVWVTRLDGVVGVALEEHLDTTLRRAREERVHLLVVELDTPGGLVASMNAMARAIAGSSVPVAVWVGPSGARAASAGAFLVQAAHVAALAPGTHLGAAHPVGLGGKDLESKELDRKIVNDLSARMRALAQERGRNPEMAARMVGESVSLTAREALAARVVDLLAPDVPALLRGVEGRTVVLQGGRAVELHPRGQRVVPVPLPLRLKLLEAVSRPDVAALALSAGAFALILEASAPGGYLFGTAGVLLLLVASYGLKVLPVNLAGVALLLAGVGILAADLFVGGVGVLSLLGIGALGMGALLSFRAPGGELLPPPSPSLYVVLALLGLCFAVVLRAVWRAQRKRPTSGVEELTQAPARVVVALDPEGMVLHRGELWKARLREGGFAHVGEEVRVVEVRGLLLEVESLSPVEGKDPVSDEEGSP